MALLIDNAKIKNTEISAPQIYARLQYIAVADGNKVQCVLLTGLNKADVLAYKTIATNIPENMPLVLDATQNQDLATIHEVVKSKLEELGFGVTIDLA